MLEYLKWNFVRRLHSSGALYAEVSLSLIWLLGGHFKGP